MTADLWALAAAGLLIGAAAAWLRHRRLGAGRPGQPAAAERDTVNGLPTCEGIGPRREPPAD